MRTCIHKNQKETQTVLFLICFWCAFLLDGIYIHLVFLCNDKAAFFLFGCSCGCNKIFVKPPLLNERTHRGVANLSANLQTRSIGKDSNQIIDENACAVRTADSGNSLGLQNLLVISK